MITLLAQCQQLVDRHIYVYISLRNTNNLKELETKACEEWRVSAGIPRGLCIHIKLLAEEAGAEGTRNKCINSLYYESPRCEVCSWSRNGELLKEEKNGSKI